MSKLEIYNKIMDEMEEKLIRTDVDIRTVKKLKARVVLVPVPNAPQQEAGFRQTLSQLDMMKDNIITAKEVIIELIDEENKLSGIKIK
jgi:hypothetical protein